MKIATQKEPMLVRKFDDICQVKYTLKNIRFYTFVQYRAWFKKIDSISYVYIS